MWRHGKDGELQGEECNLDCNWGLKCHHGLLKLCKCSDCSIWRTPLARACSWMTYVCTSEAYPTK